jgi:AcrR family transcriptional regulator
MPRAERLDRAVVARTAAALADAAGDVEHITLAQVAEKLGVRIPSLYNHVEGLAGLRREVALLGVRALTTQVQAAAIGRAGDDAVIAIAHAVRAFGQTHPGLYTASLRAVDPADQELSAAAQALLDVLLRALAAYQLSETDALHAIRGLRSIVHGFVSLEAAGGFGLPLDLDESFDRLVRGFVANLRSAHREPFTSS